MHNNNRLLHGRRPAFLPPALAPFLDRVEVHPHGVVTLRLSEPLPLELIVARRGDEITVWAYGSPRDRWQATAHDADGGRVAFGQAPAETLIRAGLSQVAAVPDLSEVQRAHAHAIAAIASGRWRSMADASGWAVARMAKVPLTVGAGVVNAMRARAAHVDGRRIAGERWAGWRPEREEQVLVILHEDIVARRWPEGSLLPDVRILAGMYESDADAVRTVLMGLLGRGLVMVDERFAVPTGPAFERPIGADRRLWDRVWLRDPRLGQRLTALCCFGERSVLLSLRDPRLDVWVALDDLGLTSRLGLHVATPGGHSLTAFRSDLRADVDADGVIEAVADLAAVLANAR
jgi:hypothetical protein